jgi:hypothetical protein
MRMVRNTLVAASAGFVCLVLARGNETSTPSLRPRASNSYTLNLRPNELVNPTTHLNYSVIRARFETNPPRSAPDSRKAVPPGPGEPIDADALKPGMYKTTPFACIVIVPESHLDGGFVVRIPGCDPNMPVLKPDLHFIPISPRQANGSRH